MPWEGGTCGRGRGVLMPTRGRKDGKGAPSKGMPALAPAQKAGRVVKRGYRHFLITVRLSMVHENKDMNHCIPNHTVFRPVYNLPSMAGQYPRLSPFAFSASQPCVGNVWRPVPEVQVCSHGSAVSESRIHGLTPA